jgi:TonB family protein
MNSVMSAAKIQSDWVGRVIDGRFSLLQWLGGGARSGVFLTELPGPQAKKAAIKLSPDDGADSDETVASWAAARPLSHPHLMRLIHTGRCKSEGEAVLYAVSEYADEVLSEILPERALTPDEAKEMLVPVIDALEYLHGKGLVHGHLKPRNVMVVDDQLKLSGDKLRAASETETPDVAGSIYDAPERATGTVSAAGDVWSLGVLLVEALTQRPPVWDRVSSGDPLVPESIPQALGGIARECLRRDVASRCTLAHVTTWLRTGQPGVLDSVDQTGTKLPRRAWIAALVVAAVAVVALVARVEMRPKPADEPRQTMPSQADALPAAADDSAASTAQTPTETPTPVIQKPSPAVVAGSANKTSVAQVPATQTPAPETHASRPIQMRDMNAGGPVVQQVMPEYLPKALESIHGTFVVQIRVTVDQAGNVTNAAYSSAGPSGYFAKASLDAAKKWKFKPGQGGSGKWNLHFVFTREGPQVTTEAAQ